MDPLAGSVDGLDRAFGLLPQVAEEQGERQDTQHSQQQSADDRSHSEVCQQPGDHEHGQHGDVLHVVDRRLLGSVEALPEVIGEVADLLEQRDGLFLGTPEEDLDLLPGAGEKSFDAVHHWMFLASLE